MGRGERARVDGDVLGRELGAFVGVAEGFGKGKEEGDHVDEVGSGVMLGRGEGAGLGRGIGAFVEVGKVGPWVGDGASRVIDTDVAAYIVE